MDAVLGLGRALPDPRGLPAIGRITPQPGFLAMQSIGQPRRISYGGGCRQRRVDDLRLAVYSHLRLPSELPLVVGCISERAAAAGS